MKKKYENTLPAERQRKQKEYKCICAVCGNEFIAHSHTNKYCSYSCKRSMRKAKTYTLKCKECGTEFISDVTNRRFCHTCKEKILSGEIARKAMDRKPIDKGYEERLKRVQSIIRGSDINSFSCNVQVCVILEALADELTGQWEDSKTRDMLADYACMIHRTYAEVPL